MTVAASAVERYTCSGADPGVAFSSTWYPIPRIELTVVGNTDSDAWPKLGALDRLIRDDRA